MIDVSGERVRLGEWLIKFFIYVNCKITDNQQKPLY